MSWETNLLKQIESSASLNFRGLDLTTNDIENIVACLNRIRPMLNKCKSVSFSYNAELRDSGTIGFLKALPANIEEIGMVGCENHDKGGEALIV